MSKREKDVAKALEALGELLDHMALLSEEELAIFGKGAYEKVQRAYNLVDRLYEDEVDYDSITRQRELDFSDPIFGHNEDHQLGENDSGGPDEDTEIE